MRGGLDSSFVEFSIRQIAEFTEHLFEAIPSLFTFTIVQIIRIFSIY